MPVTPPPAPGSAAAPHLQEAACLLFGPEEVGGRDFWVRLDARRVKQAFRRQVRLWHPDAPARKGVPEPFRREHFLAVKRAYDLLLTALAPRTAAAPRLVAVAGAKGGVGASLVAAHLGVLLARQGHRVVLADLAPAGPTLAWYLGLGPRPFSAPDYRGEPSLAAWLEPTPFGPAVLAGLRLDLTGTEAGRKQRRRFLTALQATAGDYLLCDLGCGISEGLWDIFSAADRQLLVTTCEPAAYVRAYELLKLARIRRQETPPEIGGTAQAWSPLLLVNQVSSPDLGLKVGRRLEEVAARFLGLKIRALLMPYFRELAAGTFRPVPQAARRATGPAREALLRLSRILLGAVGD